MKMLSGSSAYSAAGSGLWGEQGPGGGGAGSSGIQVEQENAASVPGREASGTTWDLEVQAVRAALWGRPVELLRPWRDAGGF